jgi:hypothetical protein
VIEVHPGRWIIFVAEIPGEENSPFWRRKSLSREEKNFSSEETGDF